MDIFTTDRIRNIAILGHGGAGKTSLVEAMAYLAGTTKRMGKISDGNTISDYDKEEIKRSFSIRTSLVPIVWDNVKINFLDTPGYFDFVGEVEEAISVCDGAIIVVSGKNGIEVGTTRAYELCQMYNIPCMFFVTEMDVDQASYREVVEGLQKMYGKKIAPFHLPIRENETFVGYINVVTQTANRWDENKEVYSCDIPDYSMTNLEICRNALMEAVAETSEDFLERFFNGESFSENEIRQALRVNVCDGSMIPVSMGSCILAQGMYTLLDDIIKYFPSPDKRTCTGISAKSNEVFQANYDFSKPKSAYIFKTIVDPFIGKYSLIKVNSGVLKTDDLLYNYHQEVEEKIGKLYVLCGNKVEEVKELHAGDLGALAKLSKAKTTDSLSTKQNPILYIRTKISTPYTAMRFKVKKKGEEDKVAQALHKICQEDLTVKVVNDTENQQSLLYAIGKQQLEIVQSLLLQRYKVEIDLQKPKIGFKETIQGMADVEGKYKKQSGGHGQYGHVKMKFSSLGDYSKSYTFEQEVVGGTVPKNYFPAVEKGLQESVLKGPLAAYPVLGVKAVLYDGSYHPVDSSELAFKMATKQAFKTAFLAAKPLLLEPVVTLKVVVKENYTGDIMGDLNKRRGKVIGMNPMENGKTQIIADIPEMELYEYGTTLLSMTGGAGTYSYEFARFEPVPPQISEGIIKSRSEKVSSLDEE